MSSTILTKGLLLSEKKHASLQVQSFKDQEDEDILLCESILTWLELNSFRYSVLLRECGLLKVLCEKMKVLGTIKLFFNDDDHKILFLLKCIELTMKLIITTGAAKEFVAYNGHGILLQLMKVSTQATCSSNNNEHTTDLIDRITEAIDYLLDEISTLSSSIGCPFPTLSNIAILYDDEIACTPLIQYDFMSDQDQHKMVTTHIDTNNSAAITDSSVETTVDTIDINDYEVWSTVLQSINLTQECQFTVGYLMWPAAVILGRWIRYHYKIFENKDFILHELGAGLGLSGLVAASSGVFKQLILSDFNEICIKNLNENIFINNHHSNCEAISLDWTKIDEIMENKDIINDNEAGDGGGDDEGDVEDKEGRLDQCDVIIASDVICQVNDAYNLSHTIAKLLKPSGIAFIIIPIPSNRFGTEAFPESLKHENLNFEKHDITLNKYLYDIQEASFFTWNAFVIWKGNDDGENDVGSFMKQEKWHEEFISAVRNM